MNRELIRKEKLLIEKKLTEYTIRLDKLDNTIKEKQSMALAMAEVNEELVIELNQTISKLQLQSIKLSAEYDLMIRRHRHIDGISDMNRIGIDELTNSKHAENNRSVGSRTNLQPAGLRTS